MSRKKWTVQKLNKDLASTIAERYSIDPLTALLLTQRGFDTFDKLDEFFDDSEEWIDPFLLPDMDKAVERINDAIFDGERICVYGDYDCDGVTSTTILYSYLEAQGADVTYMLPEREREIVVMRFGLEGRKELTQKEVAQQMGISQSYISRLEKRIIQRMKKEMLRAL